MKKKPDDKKDMKKVKAGAKSGSDMPKSKFGGGKMKKIAAGK